MPVIYQYPITDYAITVQDYTRYSTMNQPGAGQNPVVCANGGCPQPFQKFQQQPVNNTFMWAIAVNTYTQSLL